jgi:hypothetical protein
MYDGGFDSAYFNSANATGNLYVCGNTGLNPTLYQVPIAAGTMGTPAAITALTPAANSPACSPVTDLSSPGSGLAGADFLQRAEQRPSHGLQWWGMYPEFCGYALAGLKSVRGRRRNPRQEFQPDHPLHYGGDPGWHFGNNSAFLGELSRRN